MSANLDLPVILDSDWRAVDGHAWTLWRRIPNQAFDIEDLKQAGALAVLQARNQYQKSKQIPFAVFKWYRVRGAMIDELKISDWAPRSVRRSQRAINAAAANLARRLDRAPSAAEIAAESDMSLTAYHGNRLDVHNAFLGSYIETGNDEQPPSAIADHLAAPFANPDDAYIADARRQALVEAIAALPRRQQQILDLYYRAEFTQQQIGVRLGVSESRICQLCGHALRYLRETLSDWRED